MNSFVSNVRRQVGWFVILGFGAILFILFMISIRTDIFAEKFYLNFSPPSAAAFYVGQPVKFQGFTIGRIGNMELRDSGNVMIRLHLLERYHPMLHEGSKIRLVRDGLIGDQTVEITSGNHKQPVVSDGQAIGFEAAASIEELLQDVKPAIDHANTLLVELVTLAKWLNNPESDIRQVSARLNEISRDLTRENVREVTQSFTQVLADLQALTNTLQEQRVAERLSNSLMAATQILNDMRPLTETLAEQGPKSLELIASLLNHVDRLSKSLDKVATDLSDLTPELPGLARESRATIREMQEMLKQMQGSWLLGNRERKQESETQVAPPVLDMKP